MGELVISPATEHDRATFLASVDGLFHEDAGVRDVYADQEWVARGGAAYFADLLTNPEAIPLLARDRERALGHLVGRVLEPDTLRPGTRVAALESMRVVPEARGRGVGGRLVAAFFDWAKEHGAVRANVTRTPPTRVGSASTADTASCRPVSRSARRCSAGLYGPAGAGHRYQGAQAHRHRQPAPVGRQLTVAAVAENARSRHPERPETPMRFTSQTSSEGVFEQHFLLGDIPGVLWTPGGADGTRPLIAMGHGGGQHKKAPGIVDLARRLVAECGFAVVAVDAPSHGDRPEHEDFTRIATDYEVRLDAGEGLAPLIASFQALVVRQIVPEWQAVLDAVEKLSHVGTGPVGYWGLSLGCVIGVPFVAAESRVRAAVLGLGGGEVSAESAVRITVPVEFLVQWDDERVPRTQSLALFDAFASAEKTLHANLGKHGEIPAFERDSTLRFFARHLC